MQNQGSTNNTTIIISVIVVVLVALGVWWYLDMHPAPATQAPQSAPATGQLQGTVQ